MRSHPGVSVIVDGGGTSTGVEALIRSEVAICAASRSLAPAEVQRLFDVFRHPRGEDAHRPGRAERVGPPGQPGSSSVPGRARRDILGNPPAPWSDFGGNDREITVVVRPPASGTFRFFRDRVLAQAAPTRTGPSRLPQPGMWSSGSPPIQAAIGYGGAAYGTVGVRASWPSTGFLPTAEVDDELSRIPADPASCVLHRRCRREGLPPEEFIDWCQGAVGQRVVAEIGYLPLWRPALM